MWIRIILDCDFLIQKKNCILNFIFSAALIFALASANDRKVPSKTPPERLVRLHGFATRWIDANIASALGRPDRADRMTTNVGRMVTKLDAGFDKCGFFDPTVPFGGPRPQNQRKIKLRGGKYQRKGRAKRDVENTGDEILDQEELRSVRLSSNPVDSWRQIGTAFRKWIYRYISECGGEVQDQSHTKRLNKVFIIFIL